MQLVIDANILLAGLMRKSTTRALILRPWLELFSPEHLLMETEFHLMHDDRFRRRLNLSKEEVQLVLSILLLPVTVIPAKQYRGQMKRAGTLVAHPEDAPYVALSLYLNAPLWTNDRGLRDLATISTITTAELVKQIHGS